MAALRGAAELARALAAELQLIRAFVPDVAPVDAEMIADVARHQLDVAAEALPRALNAGRVFIEATQPTRSSSARTRSTCS
jgi:hypothetical protein